MKASSLLLIGLGGGLGSILRALCGYWLRGIAPWGTLLINLGGSLLIGLLVAAFVSGASASGTASAENVRLFGVVGFCGGFTTFSAFSYENVLLLEQGRPLQALAYMLLSVVLCVGAAYVGLRLGRMS